MVFFRKVFGKLQTRLIFIVISGLLIFSMSYYFYSIHTQRSIFNYSFNKSTDELLNAIKLGIEVGLSNENYETINMVFSWAKNDSDVVFIVLTDENNLMFASFPEDFSISISSLTDKSNNINIEDSTIVKSADWSTAIGKGKIFMGFSTKTIINFQTQTIYDIGSINLIFVLITTLVLIVFTAGITKPLNRLKNISDEIKNGNFDARMDEIHGGTELTSVATAFNQMVKQLTETQETLQKDINEAVGFVESLIPKPIDSPVNIDWLFSPSDRLGGDSFGYHLVDDNKLAIYLIDVSGHGVGAALYSISVYNLIREESIKGTNFADPASLLSSLNQIFQMEKYDNKYFTIWYGVLDFTNQELLYSSAGHLPALLYNNDKTVALEGGSMFIGAFEETVYENKKINVNKGNMLYVFSDGLFEFRKKDGSMFTFDEYIEVINNISKNDADFDQLLKNLQHFKLNKNFDDDLSLLKISI